MDNIRKERLIISICTMAGLSCIIQNHFGGWEFWVPFVVFAGLIGLWIVHITDRLDQDSRILIDFIFAAFLLFYHGIHNTSLFDLSVSVVLFMVTFTIMDSNGFLNAILVEYILLMILQFRFLFMDSQTDLDAFDTMRVIYHICTVLTMYVFSRITVERRNAEKERTREWIETVRQNDHDMEDFLSNISHELRTPVNVISGMTTVLQKDDDREELVSIQKAGVRLAHQIEDIQDYTEIKRGELHLDEENYMIISLINDVVTDQKVFNGENDLELIVDLDPKTPTMLRGDIRKIHKIFRHLIENAVKFTKQGGICIRVYPVTRKYGINLILEVQDTGIGMTRADMSHVSKGMYQANKERNRSTGGIGIGLPIVYGIVHKMGGFVNISSIKGKGTTVRVSIPQQVIDPSFCLGIKGNASIDVVFYIRPEKYTVPEIRDMYRAMEEHLEAGLKIRLYPAQERRDLEKLAAYVEQGYIFTGEEEYKADGDLLDELAKDGYRIVVFTNDGSRSAYKNGVMTVSKPIYAFPVVRVINGEYSSAGLDDKGKPMFGGVTALVVDDEPMNLVVATGLLKDYGIKTDTAESGKEAISKYENEDYDVIFMDHMMPEMDGVETAKRIRKVADTTYRRPLIIALTANALSGAKEMFEREGFDGFIAKPIDIGEFEYVMKNALPEEMIQYEGRDDG